MACAPCSGQHPALASALTTIALDTYYARRRNRNRGGDEDDELPKRSGATAAEQPAALPAAAPETSCRTDFWNPPAEHSTVIGTRQRAGQRGIHLEDSVSLVAGRVTRGQAVRRRLAGRLARFGQKLEKKPRRTASC